MWSRVVRRQSVVHPSVVNVFDFLSKTAERNLTKLDRKQERNVFCQVFFFGIDAPEFHSGHKNMFRGHSTRLHWLQQQQQKLK